MVVNVIYTIKNARPLVMCRATGYIHGVYVSALGHNHGSAIQNALNNFKAFTER